MQKRFVVLSGLILILLVGGVFWWKINLLAVDSSDQTSKIFVVQKGEGVRGIASRLKKENLIRNQIAFFLLIKKLRIDQNLQAGDFRLNPGMDGETVAKTLTVGTLDVWVTIPEGWRNEEIALKLAQDLSLPEKEFLKYSVEGYMFPDTYLIPKEATGAAIAKLMTVNFQKKVTPDLQKEASKSGLTIKQVITMASIVEKEARGEADRNIIAGILLKRLKADWPLQVDATIQYALGYQPETKSWWKKELFEEDKKNNSPYNTYLNPGLPPGPICNPGLASIKAVIYPQASDDWYYLHSQDGVAHYAKTIEEHEANITKYLQ